MHIYDQIQELHAELRGCILSVRERKETERKIHELASHLKAQEQEFEPEMPHIAPPD